MPIGDFFECSGCAEHLYVHDMPCGVVVVLGRGGVFAVPDGYVQFGAAFDQFGGVFGVPGWHVQPLCGSHH